MSTVSHGLKQLADTIETLENSGRQVTDITTRTGEFESGEGLSAEFSVQISLPLSGGDGEDSPSTFSATEAEVRQDGTVRVSFEGQLTDEVVQSPREAASIEQPSQEVATGTPPHRDPEALAEVYERCDTFVEMKRALGADVTSEAVRQQMVKHGIHEVPDERPQLSTEDTQEADAPDEAEAASNEGASERPDENDADADRDSWDDISVDSSMEPEEGTRSETTTSTEVVLSDGGFQADLTVDELKDVVQSSRTLYEATRKLRVDREEAREMLERLNLLDLVTGRLDTEDERNVTGEEIDRRIRSSNLVARD